MNELTYAISAVVSDMTMSEAVALTGCEVCGSARGVDCPPNEFGKRDIHVRRWEAALRLQEDGTRA